MELLIDNTHTKPRRENLKMNHIKMWQEEGVKLDVDLAQAEIETYIRRKRNSEVRKLQQKQKSERVRPNNLSFLS